jgi:hypothetical protein
LWPCRFVAFLFVWPCPRGEGREATITTRGFARPGTRARGLEIGTGRGETPGLKRVEIWPGHR